MRFFCATPAPPPPPGDAASDIREARVLTDTAGRQSSVRVAPYMRGFEVLRHREIAPIPARSQRARESVDAVFVFPLQEMLNYRFGAVC